MPKTLFMLVALLLWSAGCASNIASPCKDACQAQCPVCVHNADLACVDVHVTDQTPKYDYNGKTYYFCSNECRDEFAHNPAKYLRNN